MIGNKNHSYKSTFRSGSIFGVVLEEKKVQTPYTMPLWRSTLDGSHVSQKVITRSRVVEFLVAKSSTKVGSSKFKLEPTSPNHVIGFLGHVASMQSGST